MFTDDDFDVFEIEGLETRMAAIRGRIQPTFQEVLEAVAPVVSEYLGQQVFIHIAQHRRRTKYAPDSTWAALSLNNRGYKSEPHLQVGIWGGYVSNYLSLIDQPPAKQAMADALLNQIDVLESLPADFVYSTDHTLPDYQPIANDLKPALVRLRDVKKGEFQLGRVILRGDPLLSDPQQQLDWMFDTYRILLPLLRNCLQAQSEER